MHRLLVAPGLLEAESPVLPKDAANHLKVLRPKEGEEIELSDGRGRWRVFAFRRADGRSALVASAPLRAVPRAPWSLTLFACVTKGSRWDWTVEKATELGATRIVPVVSARTVVRIARGERAAKRARWMRVAEDAARQSDAKWLPEILEPVDFGEALPLVRGTTCLVGALTTPPPPPILSCLPDARTSANLSLFVGPEGDFSPEELAALLEIATPVSFGSTVLRAETAAIYGLGVLKAFLDASQSRDVV